MFFSTRDNVKRAQAERVYDHQDLLTRQEERRQWMRWAGHRWVDSLVGQSFPKTMGDMLLHFVMLAIVCLAIFGTVTGVVGVFEWIAAR
jgi:hypothetical protein